MEDKVTHFYYQVLADGFAKELPGVRRAEEQLAALAGDSKTLTLKTGERFDGKGKISRSELICVRSCGPVLCTSERKSAAGEVFGKKTLIVLQG